jgi:Fanconi anemia group D2 protein
MTPVHLRRFLLATEPAVFRRSLSRRLDSEARHSSNDIFQSLQSCLEEESTLRQCLMPIVVEQTTLSRYCIQNVTRAIYSLCTNSASLFVRNTSESLIRNLLSIDQMQPKLITYLLERLPEFYDELEEK